MRKIEILLIIQLINYRCGYHSYKLINYMNDSHIKIISKNTDKKIYLDCKNFFLTELKFIRNKVIITEELAKKMAYFCILAYECDVIKYYLNDNDVGVIRYVGDDNQYHPTPIVIKNILPKKCLVQMSIFIAKNQNRNYKVEIRCMAFDNFYNGNNLSIKSKYTTTKAKMIRSVSTSDMDRASVKNQQFVVLDDASKLDCLNCDKLKGHIMRFSTTNTNSDVMQFEWDLGKDDGAISYGINCSSHNNIVEWSRYVFALWVSTSGAKSIEIKVSQNIYAKGKIYKLIQVRKFISRDLMMCANADN